MRSLARSTTLFLVPVAVAALAACSGLTDPTEPTPDTTPPAVPLQLTPPSGAAFNHFPRNTTLAWGSVSDPSSPVTYRVEVQYCELAIVGLTCTTRTTWCAGVLTGTTCNFDFGFELRGRWRVRAVDDVGNQSAFSDWWTFTFSPLLS